MSIRSRHVTVSLVLFLALVAFPLAVVAIASADPGLAPAGAQTPSGASFTPGSDVPLDWVNAIDDHGRLAGYRSGVGAVYDPATGVVTEIGELGGGSSAEAITDGGLVVGNSRLTPGSPDLPILYDLTTGTLTELGSFGFLYAGVRDVTDSGFILGAGFSPPDVVQSFVHDRTTGTTTPFPVGFEALTVNEQGLVLGREPGGSVVIDARTGARTDLNTRIDGLLGVGGLSDTALVAGLAARLDGGDGDYDVFVHDLATGTTDRLAFNGFQSGSFPAVEGVTDGGAVIGTSVGLDMVRGFIAVPDAGLVEPVPPMPGDLTTSAELLNNRGELAGRSCYWEDVTPALHCDQPFRSTVVLPPSPPRTLTVSGCAAPATLSWSAPRFDGFVPLDGYDVLRDGVTISTLPQTARTFTDPTAVTDANYAVVARNRQGDSPPSAVAVWPSWPCRGGTVRGTVSAVGAPQAGIGVRLVDAADGHLVRTSVTDASGGYRFASVPPGRYVLRFHDPTLRLLLEWFDDAPNRASAQPIDVGLTGEVVADADLAVAARIEGTVTDGVTGLAGINVRVYDLGGVLVAKTVTRPDGSFVLGSLRAGSVKVRFDDPTGWHQVQWLGPATTFAAAPAFPLGAGEVLRADHRLDGAGVLEGTVRDGDGAPVVGIPVRIYDPTTRIAFRKTVTDESGHYRVGALPGGSVLIRFGDQITYPVEWFRDQPSSATADPVTIAVGCTSTVDSVVATTFGSGSAR